MGESPFDGPGISEGFEVRLVCIDVPVFQFAAGDAPVALLRVRCGCCWGGKTA
jgi:hypothetical protein